MKRLEAVLSFIENCGVLADIGTDHAIVPIMACAAGKCKRAVASDINPGPLARAAANIRARKLEDRVETRLGGGLSPLAPGEADCIIIAGMGGINILQILEESPQTARSAGLLVLQPQRDAVKLRVGLHDLFFCITNEIIARESNRFYHIIAARPAEAREQWSDEDYITGKYEKDRDGDIWREFAVNEIKKITGLIKKVEAAGEKSRTDSLETLYYQRDLFLRSINNKILFP